MDVLMDFEKSRGTDMSKQIKISALFSAARLWIAPFALMAVGLLSSTTVGAQSAIAETSQQAAERIRLETRQRLVPVMDFLLQER